MAVITLNNVKKIYPLGKTEVKAVNGVSFDMEKGDFISIAGPSGSGKSTILNMIGCIDTPTEGQVKILGKDTGKLNDRELTDLRHRVIGFIFQSFNLIPVLNVYENIEFPLLLGKTVRSKRNNKDWIDHLIREVGLEDAINRKVGTFSKGMVQLLGVAQVMIGTPPVYILDEPMGGLDARWVKTIREKIKYLNEQGATILLSSHILSEVEAVCDRVAIISKGKLIAEDTVPNLNKYLQIKPRLEISILGLNGNVPEEIRKMKGVESVNAEGDMLYVTCESSIRIEVITKLKDLGYNVKDIITIEPSLEDAFIKLIDTEEGGT